MANTGTISILRYRHYRIKIFIMALFYYIIYHCSGLLWIVGLYSEESAGAGWDHPAFWAVSVSLIFQLLAIFIYILMAFNILFTHHQFLTNAVWLHKITILAKTGTLFYSLGILFIIVRAVQVETLFFEVYLMVMNKVFLFMLVFTIVYDLNRRKQRFHRLYLYGEILQFFSFFHALLLTYGTLVFVASNQAGVALALFVAATAFWMIFAAAIQYSFFAQRFLPICHISRVTNAKLLCPYRANTIAYHLLIGGFVVLLLTMIELNFVECLSTNLAFEALYAIRSYGFLNFFFCVIAAIEYSMVGLPNVKYPPLENDDDDDGEGIHGQEQEHGQGQGQEMNLSSNIGSLAVGDSNNVRATTAGNGKGSTQPQML